MSFIFENQNVRDSVSKNEPLIDKAFSQILNHNLMLESYIHENLAQFTADSAAEFYNNIRDFVINENTIAYSQVSEILADTELSDDEKVACFELGSYSSDGRLLADVKPFTAATKAKDTELTSYTNNPPSAPASTAEVSFSDKVLGKVKEISDEVKDLAQTHPYAAGALGATAGIGAGYGAYRMLKNRSSKK